MSRPRTLVWLPRVAEAPATVAAQQRDLRGRCTVLTIPVTDLLTADRPDPARAAGALRKRLGRSSGPVYGAGGGALVALHLAAMDDGRVPWLAVSVPPADGLPTVRSAWATARRLLPARTLAELDQARAADYRRVVSRVACPVWVLCGASDRAALPVGRALARRLPRGELRLVPGAGPHWTEERPHQVGEVLRQLVETAA